MNGARFLLALTAMAFPVGAAGAQQAQSGAAGRKSGVEGKSGDLGGRRII